MSGIQGRYSDNMPIVYLFSIIQAKINCYVCKYINPLQFKIKNKLFFFKRVGEKKKMQIHEYIIFMVIQFIDHHHDLFESFNFK